MPATSAAPNDALTITDDILQQFQNDGYAVVRQLATPSEVRTIREAFMSAAASGPVQGLSDGHFAQASPGDPLAFYPRMLHPHLHAELPIGAIAMRIMLDRRIQTYLRAFMQEEPLAAQSMFYFKPPGARGQELHQDNFYLRVKPGTCVAAWMAIDDADEENGTLMVVPQTSHAEIACPETADAARSFTTDYVRPPAGLEPAPLRLSAGDVLFFNGSVIHGSYPNLSKERFRRALICHYVPASSTEVSAFYRLFDFSGNPVAMAEAQGGGPCGTGAAGPH